MWKKRELAECEALRREFLERTRARLEPSHPDTWLGLHLLGDVLDERGDIDGAEACFHEWLSLLERHSGPASDRREGALSLARMLIRQARALIASQPQLAVVKLEETRRLLTPVAEQADTVGHAATACRDAADMCDVWAILRPGEGFEREAQTFRAREQELRRGR